LLRGGYEHLCLPAEFEPDRRCSTSIGWKDPRSTPGELLSPERIDQATLEGLKATLGSIVMRASSSSGLLQTGAAC